MTCSECGAIHPDPERDCHARFHMLLVLDHSRREPWGPLHGLAFSTFALQHPSGHDHGALVRSWVALWRVVRRGDDPVRLFEAMRRQEADVVPADWDAPPLPSIPAPGGPYRVTIVDLGDFKAASYRERAMDWARATVERWEAAE